MKSKTSFYHSGTLALAVLASTLLLWGCETKDEVSDKNTLQIKPAYATVKPGSSVTLHATGGANYYWTLEDAEIGSLNTSVGAAVVYTARVASDKTQKVTLTGSSDRYPEGGELMGVAEAHIRHLPTAGDGGGLTAAPAATTATVGGAAVLITASGGDGSSYAWSLSNKSIGKLSKSSGREVTYQATDKPGATQSITLSSNGKSYQFVIIHN